MLEVTLTTCNSWEMSNNNINNIIVIVSVNLQVQPSVGDILQQQIHVRNCDNKPIHVPLNQMNLLLTNRACTPPPL